MNSIYKSKYIEIFIDLDRSLIFDVWTEASENIYNDEQIFIDVIAIWRDIVLQNNIKYALTDIRQMQYNPPPEIQDNVIKEAQKIVINHGLQKQAFIVSSDFIQVLMMQQVTEEFAGTTEQGNSNFFSSQEEAEKWLLS